MGSAQSPAYTQLTNKLIAAMRERMAIDGNSTSELRSFNDNPEAPLPSQKPLDSIQGAIDSYREGDTQSGANAGETGLDVSSLLYAPESSHDPASGAVAAIYTDGSSLSIPGVNATLSNGDITAAVGSGRSLLAGTRVLQAEIGAGASVVPLQPFDIESGQAALRAVEALPPSVRQRLADAATSVGQAILNGGNTAGPAIRNFAQKAGSAVYQRAMTPAGHFLDATARIIGSGLSAPIRSAFSGTTSNLAGGVGAAIAGGSSMLAGYYAGLDSPLGLTVAGVLTAGVNIGLKPPPNFDADLQTLGGKVGVAAGYFFRYIVSAGTGVGVGVGVQKIQEAIGHKGSKGVPDTLPADAMPFPATNTTQSGTGRGLLSQGLTTADQQGINSAASAVWKQWTSDAAIKADIAAAFSSPGGGKVVMQQLYQTASINYANQKTNATLASFAKSNPTAYHNYLTYVGRPNGPAASLETADQDVENAQNTAQNLLNSQLAIYIKTNPNGSLADFYKQLPPAVTSQLSELGNTMSINNALANSDIAEMGAAYQSFSTTGNPPTTADLSGIVPPNAFNSNATTTPTVGETPKPTLQPGTTGPGAGAIIGSSAATGAAAGAVAGLAGGPLAEITVPVGAAIGGAIGAALGAVAAALSGKP